MSEAGGTAGHRARTSAGGVVDGAEVARIGAGRGRNDRRGVERGCGGARGGAVIVDGHDSAVSEVNIRDPASAVGVRQQARRMRQLQ